MVEKFTNPRKTAYTLKRRRPKFPRLTFSRNISLEYELLKFRLKSFSTFFYHFQNKNHNFPQISYFTPQKHNFPQLHKRTTLSQTPENKLQILGIIAVRKLIEKRIDPRKGPNLKIIQLFCEGIKIKINYIYNFYYPGIWQIFVIRSHYSRAIAYRPENFTDKRKNGPLGLFFRPY